MRSSSACTECLDRVQPLAVAVSREVDLLLPCRPIIEVHLTLATQYPDAVAHLSGAQQSESWVQGTQAPSTHAGAGLAHPWQSLQPGLAGGWSQLGSVRIASS